MGLKNTVKLKKYQDICNEFFAEEAIPVGSLLEVTSTGGVIKNTVVTYKPTILVALEDELQGHVLADAYADNAPVQTWAVQAGEEVQLVATGAIAVGGAVELVADGSVQALAAGVSIGEATWAAEGGYVGVRIN